MGAIETFIEAIDAEWQASSDSKLRLKVIGAGALLLQVGYDRGTKDGDILETMELTPEIKADLVALAGKETVLAKRHGFYVQLVSNGIPALRQRAVWRPVTALNERLEKLTIEALDVVDVVVSKLARYHATDAKDIEAMIRAGHVEHAAFVDCFLQTVDWFTSDGRSYQLPKWIEHFNEVERDVFGVKETAIELPECSDH